MAGAMTFAEAKVIGRRKPVRQKAWLNRCVRWQGALAHLMPFDPYRRSWGQEHIVRAEDVSPQWWAAEWTDEPVPVAEYYPALCRVALSAPGLHTMRGWPGYSQVAGRTPVYLRSQDLGRQIEDTSGTWESPAGNWSDATGYTATRAYSRDSVTSSSGGQVDPETGVLSTVPPPLEGDRSRESFVWRVRTHSPAETNPDHAWTVRQTYPDLETVVDGDPPAGPWWQNFPELVDPSSPTWGPAMVLQLGDSTDTLARADIRQTTRERVWHYTRAFGADTATIRSERTDITGTLLSEEYTLDALRLRAIAAIGLYGAEAVGSSVAQLTESSVSEHVPSPIWTGEFHSYLRYAATCGRYRLSAEIPYYDGHGGYVFHWRIVGGGWDEYHTAEVIPEIGEIVCSTPVTEIHPLAAGEVRIEDCYAVYVPALS